MELFLPLLPFLLKYLSIARAFHKRVLKSVRQFIINPRPTQTNKQQQEQINSISETWMYPQGTDSVWKI